MLGVDAAVGCGLTLDVGAVPVVGVAVATVPGCGLVAAPVLGALPAALPGALWLVEPAAAGPFVGDSAGEVTDDGCALVAEPAIGAVPGAAWPVEPAALLAAPALVLGSPVDCPATCPFAGWPLEMWACGEAGSGAIDGWTWPEPVAAELPRSAAGAWVPGAPDLIVEFVVDVLLSGAVNAPFENLPAASLGPLLCCAGCSALATREAAPAEGEEELDPPRSACGANPVLTVDDRSTVVVSGWEVGWDAAAEFTGVVATGWLVTALAVLAAATFAGVAPVFTGWFSADENDGERPGEPLLGWLERPE